MREESGGPSQERRKGKKREEEGRRGKKREEEGRRGKKREKEDIRRRKFFPDRSYPDRI